MHATYCAHRPSSSNGDVSVLRASSSTHVAPPSPLFSRMCMRYQLHACQCARHRTTHTNLITCQSPYLMLILRSRRLRMRLMRSMRNSFTSRTNFIIRTNLVLRNAASFPWYCAAMTSNGTDATTSSRNHDLTYVYTIRRGSITTLPVTAKPVKKLKQMSSTKNTSTRRSMTKMKVPCSVLTSNPITKGTRRAMYIMRDMRYMSQ
mmetsp:Transcript_36738/g.91497  ORF Transcript_36738/g.91497 Transcript_36738/m.91497 type:complete len:205 (-) Transcript_36738:353-967(-)